MSKKRYSTPVWINFEPPGISDEIGGSQGTTGDEFRWTLDEDNIDLTDLEEFYSTEPDDIVFEAMDTNHDYFISSEEFYAWFKPE